MTNVERLTPLKRVPIANATETTIAFVNSNPDTITDSGSGFVTAGFKVGQIINIVTGSGTNDGTYTIAAVAAGTLTLIAADTLTTENAATAGTVSLVASGIQPKISSDIFQIYDLDGDSYVQFGFDIDDVALLQLVGGTGFRLRLGGDPFLSNSGTRNLYAGTMIDPSAGENNSVLGHYAKRNVTGGSNVVIGRSALWRSSGDCNNCVAIGHACMGLDISALSVDDCVFVGKGAGLACSDNCSGFGNYSLATCAANCAALGYRAGEYETGANKLFIDSLDRTNEANGRIQSLVYGIINADPAQQALHLNAKVQAHGAIPVTYTADHTITLDEFGKSLRMNNALARTFTFPSVGANDDGARITLLKLGAGKVTIQMVDSDKVHDSSATGTMYNDTAETYARVDLEYCHATTTWNVVASGTWTTT